MDAEDEPSLSGKTSMAPESKSKPLPKFPSKTCKYAGVTFRTSRDKFQARIYKGNKEFNLGLFDVAADAALAYDVTHRLVKKITAPGMQGKETEVLESYETDKNEFPDWLDFGEDGDENDGIDTNKLNFIRHRDYMNERVKEVNGKLSSGAKQYVNCPRLEDVRSIVRTVAIRVVKTMIGAIDGGTNNYRRRGKNKNVSVDGSTLKNNPSQKRKRKDANSAASAAHSDQTLPTLVTSAYGANAGDAGAFTQWNSLGAQYPNPSRTKIELPIVSSPFVPMGFMQRHNQDIMSNLGNSHYHCNVDERHAPFLYAPSATFNASNVYDEARASTSNDIKSNFLHEANQIGPSALFGMGLGYQNGVRIGDINHHGLNSMLESPSDNYRDLFSNMRDIAGVGLGGGLSLYSAMPEELKRMMLMIAIGQSPGVFNNVGTMMSGINNPSGLTQNSMSSNGFIELTKENTESGTKDMSDGKDGVGGQAFDVHQGHNIGQNLQAYPSSSLYTSQTGGAYANAWNRNPYAFMRGDPPMCLEAGDQSAWQGAQSGLTKGSDDGLDQSSLLNSFCQVTGYPSTNVSDGGGEGIPASDEVTQFFAKLQGRNSNNINEDA